jgi:hypothetical protein
LTALARDGQTNGDSARQFYVADPDFHRDCSGSLA